jgi:ribosome-associated protein
MHFRPPFLDREFHFSASRSGGKGGQNVNKLATKVLLEFQVSQSKLLTPAEKEMLLTKLADQLTQAGMIQVVADRERTQLANRLLAVKKMYALLNACFEEKKKRKPTQPTFASEQKRLQQKKQHALTKQQRRKKWND